MEGLRRAKTKEHVLHNAIGYIEEKSGEDTPIATEDIEEIIRGAGRMINAKTSVIDEAVHVVAGKFPAGSVTGKRIVETLRSVSGAAD